MIVPVDETNLLQAATIHSISWKKSHRAFCEPDFLEIHTPDRQREYIRNKMDNGTKFFMLEEEEPIGVVSIGQKYKTGNLGNERSDLMKKFQDIICNTNSYVYNEQCQARDKVWHAINIL